MTNYTLTIKKTVPNEGYAKAVEEYETKNNRYRGMNNREMELDPNFPRQDIVKDVLIVELSEEQYKKVKVESIKVFE